MRIVLLLFIMLGLAACAPVVIPTTTRVIVEWTTASELNTAGFNLYRSESKDGPYTKINATLIPASANPLTGSHYRVEDNTAVPGQTYYYQLEDVELNGTTTRHEPYMMTVPEGLGAGILILLAALAVLLVIGMGAYLVRGRSRAAHPSAGGNRLPHTGDF